MANNIIRIRRRATGAPGAPSSLENAELAYNEVDNILYYGTGTGGSGGSATSILSIGGQGAYTSLTGNQTVAGIKTFTGTIDGTGASVLVPTVTAGDNSTKAASTAFVVNFAQPYSAALAGLAGVASNGAITRTASNTYSARSSVGTAGRILVTNGDGVAGNPTFDLASGIVTAGTYSKVTVDTYGRVTTGANISSSDVTTALGFTPENIANKGAANGYASLGGDGKVPLGQLPSAVTGGLTYQGTWNASTNTPNLVDGTGNMGAYYKVNVAGNTSLGGYTNWSVGDIAAYNGTTWDKFEGGNPDVSSVAGRVGAVVLTTADIGGLGTMATQNASAVAITGGTITASFTGNLAGNASTATKLATARTIAISGPITGTGTSFDGSANITIPVTALDVSNAAVTGTLNAVNGGTGFASYAVGDILQAATSTTFSKLAGVATGNVLLSGGVGAGSSWGKVSLTTHISGILTVANGGTGAGTLTGYVKGNGTAAFTAATTIPNTDITGLGTMSTQNASAVAITGGTITGISLDGGTF